MAASGMNDRKRLATASTDSKLGVQPDQPTTKRAKLQLRRVIRPEVTLMEHHFMWEIDQFSSRPTDTSVFSSEFKIEKDDGTLTTWKLQMEIKKNNTVGLFAVLVDSPKKELAWARFGIVDDTGDTIYSGGVFMCVFDPKSPDDCVWGYVNLVKRATLLQHKERVLPGDKLSVFCDLRMVVKEMDTATDIGHGVVTASNHMLDLYLGGEFTDCVIVCEDRELHAHKAILSARSPVFAAMFAHELKEARSNRIEVHDTAADIMDELLQHIYSGIIPINRLEIAGIAEDLFVVADKYQLLELKEACARSMSKWMAASTVCRYLMLAELHSCSVLKMDCIRFFNAYVADRKQLNNYDLLISQIPDLADELDVKDPDYFVNKEVIEE